MCPHGYHHSGSMATPALGTRDVRIYIYISQDLRLSLSDYRLIQFINHFNKSVNCII